ncbi:hypothetical protein [Streptomyces sp. KS 21]|uniref:hypothetical protein n=1 Tax=Streptomyces sp. KS 21 TaxID=2485150 RepID=UPI00106408F9|nr:hypothetical protein [Streptomyces sp. KS 21]TDU67045.1 hypothetical protein EDD91_8077 [Streptomyces sp. KS 21]
MTLRCRPRVTAAAVGHLAGAGLLVRLGGDPEFPDVHPVDGALLMSEHGHFGSAGRSEYVPAVPAGSGGVGRFVWRGDVP